MKRILAISYYTFRQNVRNRVYYVLFIFTLIMVFVSMLLSVLGGEQPMRILLDFGLVSIEFFALLIAIFTSVTTITEEVESKTIYLILIKPIPRWYYILGRYTGILLSVWTSMLLMYAFHFLMLTLQGWHPGPDYLYAVISSSLKIAIISAVAIFFSVFSTSTASSLVFSVFIWIAGHFSTEINFLTGKMEFLPAKYSVKILYYVIPNLQYFNWRDFLSTGVSFFRWMPVAVVYAVAYIGVFMCLSSVLFEKKEV
ncbi:MAG: ABC transporter permease [Elusimicrobia bacterium]|nr:ABC transporter permease [Elusimicrobiota bacterium]